ncbi:MAG TPA: APC family permease, partial [Acidobacteriota bacterium]
MTTLARTLRTTEYFALAFGTMVGVGWLVVIDDWLTRGGPVGAMLGFLLGGLALVPVGYVYGKFIKQIPDASSEVAYAATVFPESVGYFAGWLMTLAYLIVCPWEAVAIGRILSYLFPAIKTMPLYTVGGFAVYLPTLMAGVAVTALIIFLNYRGIKLSSRFQNATTFGLLAMFAVFSVVGLSADRLENLTPAFSRSQDGLWGAVVSTILVLQIVPYFLTGFESVPKCVEEAHPDQPAHGFVKAIFLALAVGVAFYVIIIFVVSGLAPWQSLARESFATAVAFELAFRSSLIVRLILFAALISLLKVFNANFIAASRLIFALGRRGWIPSGLGAIHHSFQTPNNAVLFCGAFTICGSLLGSSILIPVTEVGSLCSLLGWGVTCVAFARWKHSQKRTEIAIAFVGAAVAITLLLLKLIPQVPGSFGKWEYLALV